MGTVNKRPETWKDNLGLTIRQLIQVRQLHLMHDRKHSDHHYGLHNPFEIPSSYQSNSRTIQLNRLLSSVSKSPTTHITIPLSLGRSLSSIGFEQIKWSVVVSYQDGLIPAKNTVIAQPRSGDTTTLLLIHPKEQAVLLTEYEDRYE